MFTHRARKFVLVNVESIARVKYLTKLEGDTFTIVLSAFVGARWLGAVKLTRNRRPDPVVV